MYNDYQNKYFSVLGDSISTLERHSVPEHASYYTHYNCLETGVFIPSDTWWGQVIDALDGRLLVNDSFSGSTVCLHPGYEIPSYGCSRERTSNLDKNGRHPDVIMVFMGTNDWGRGTEIPSSDANDLTRFSSAYQKMLDRLTANYPEAELWCFTLAISTFSKRENFRFPYRYGGTHMEEYCRAIRACAKASGAKLIDLYGTAEPYDTVDGFHPTAEGMQVIAKAVLDQLRRGKA